MHDVCTLKGVVQVEHWLPLAEYLYQGLHGVIGREQLQTGA